MHYSKRLSVEERLQQPQKTVSKYQEPAHPRKAMRKGVMDTGSCSKNEAFQLTARSGRHWPREHAFSRHNNDEWFPRAPGKTRSV